MRLTELLRKWLIAEMNVKAEATDDEYKAAAAKAMVDGKLTADKYLELTKDGKAAEADAFMAKLDAIAGGLEKLAGKLVEKEAAKADDEKVAKEKAEKEAAEKATKDKKVTPDTEKAGRLSRMIAMGPVGDGDGDEVSVHVKEAAEHYSTQKSAMTWPEFNRKDGTPHPFAGRPITDYDPLEGGRQMEKASQRDMAVCGAWAKFMMRHSKFGSKALAWNSTAEHEKELILYAMHHMDWCGNIGDDPNSKASNEANVVNRHLTSLEQKTLIDDATSGGTEAVPLPFDDMLVSTPLLFGEFFPLVNLIPIDKGRRIQGAAAGNPTITWGGIDATAIDLFDTTSYVTAFDTTIYRGQGAIRIGLDFLSDTPINFVQFITERYGQAMLREMDNVICVGNGTTQPEGVMTKAGTTSVAFGGTTTIGSYESLMFGVHKREKSNDVKASIVFGGTDTSFQRAKSIPVGASDARRIANAVTMANYQDYTWMGTPYKISDTMTNAQVFYAVLKRYRMFRRRGLVLRSSTEGDTLIRNNEMLLALTFRYGGQLERGACAAVTTTAQA